jgi:transcriptional regulator
LFDGLFVGQINVQDTPTVDLTLTATNDLSADVNVSSQPGNAVQVLPDGLFVNSINVQDTPTVDLTLTPTNDLSADVNVSAQAGNAVQVLSDGLFVAQINVQDTPTVDLTLTPTNDLSADVNVSTQAGNAIQVLPDGLFVSSNSINVQDTPTVDLTLTPTNDLSADVNVSTQAGNAIQVLPDGLFVSSNSINVQDTPTVDLTLTPTNDLSADVNISAQTGNAIQVLPDGLFVSSNSINVQDTPTVDLTLTATNDLSANVNVSAQAGNGLQVLADGLYIPSTSNPCLSNPPNLVNFPTNNLLVTYNANTGCLEQIAINSESVIYGGSSGSPNADNLRYSSSNNFLRATVGPDLPMQHSFMLYGANINVIGNFYSVIGSIINSNIANSRFSFVNVTNTTQITSIHSVVVGQNSISNNFISERSSVLFTDSSINSTENSFVSARQSAFSNLINSSFISSTNSSFQNNVIFSLVCADSVSHQNVSYSLSIARDSNNRIQPSVNYSSYIANNVSAISGTPIISHSNVNFNSVSLNGNLQIRYCTLHLQDFTLSSNNSPFQYLHSFVSSRNSSLSAVEFSFFAAWFNTNQSPDVRYSLVSAQPDSLNPRIGPSVPSILRSVVLTQNNFPNANTSVFISNNNNRWLTLDRSVCVIGGNVQVFDSNPPNNTAILLDSLIVGGGHNISSAQITSSLVLVGTNLSAGTQTVFGVGVNAYAPPAVINAGGWRAYIADGGADNANYFQGWASAWRFRMFRPSNNYANDAAAVTALNTAYGADPRNAVGTMVVALVNGNPAIFTWNGTTFVRITV